MNTVSQVEVASVIPLPLISTKRKIRRDPLVFKARGYLRTYFTQEKYRVRWILSSDFLSFVRQASKAPKLIL